jgi:hypothetical protein
MTSHKRFELMLVVFFFSAVAFYAGLVVGYNSKDATEKKHPERKMDFYTEVLYHLRRIDRTVETNARAVRNRPGVPDLERNAGDISPDLENDGGRK